MADRDADASSDPLVEVAALERRLSELDDEERGVLQRLAEIKRVLAVQRAAARPSLERGSPWKWALFTYLLGVVVSFLFQHWGR